MGEKTDQIERHIREQRRELGQSINEMEQKVKDTMNWRTQFEQHPMAMLGVAVGGGLLLSAIIGSRTRTRYVSDLTERATWDSAPPGAEALSQPRSATNEKTAQYWSAVKLALVGVAATKLAEVIESILPGFGDEYSKVRPSDDSWSAHRS